MKSDVVKINSDLKGQEEALAAAESFIAYNGFTGKNALHIQLLTEELISMIHGIMDGFEGRLWFESEKAEQGRLCRICLSANTAADLTQEEKLLGVASSGKNENAKGILGKIRELVRMSAQSAVNRTYISSYASVNGWFTMGAVSTVYDIGNCWSLTNYRNSLPDRETAREEWDELEKSIIANLSDDVKVWLKNSVTEVVIEKLIQE